MKTSITDTDKFKLPDHVSYRDIEGECVLLNTENNYYYSLNDVGFLIYKLLLERLSFSEIVQEILTRSEGKVSRERIHSDVEELLVDLLKEGLIEKSAGE